MKLFKRVLKNLLPARIVEKRRIEKLRERYGLSKDIKITGRLFISGEFSCKEGCKFLGDISIQGNIVLGRYTSLNGPNTDLQALHNSIEIGSFCSIARSVSFQEFNHRIERPSTYFMAQNVFGLDRKLDTDSKGGITIGNDVWIGMHSLILSGAHIGHGAIIGANTVVNGEIPPYAIAVGSPARVVGYRFSEKKINELLEMKWWDWPISKIQKNQDFFLNAY
ncbi:CatB-related O-acetyltransferase [Roseivirga spongicola]|uniref:CatB-related O-acetyltransferase n=1 Tax=Roseivirga spongicola TaxID=333140 RepID=UPI002AC964E4|nr:CatB-related O-acetyltransferase [Roseivirga spongicola]WPZ09169.1 CatB-related O-acetyltransferase [Roseivirga spongicola]